MQWRNLVIVLVLIILALGSLLLFNPSEEPEFVQESPPVKRGTVQESVLAPLPSVSVPQAKEKKQTSPSTEMETPETTLETDIPVVVMQQTLKHAVNDFKASMRYPRDSTPLESDHINVLEPNRFIPFKIPLDEDGEYSIEIKLSTVKYFQGDPIEVYFTLSSDGDLFIPEVLSVSAEIEDGRDIKVTFPLQSVQNEDKIKSFQGSIQAPVDQSKTWGKELYMRVRAHVAGMEEVQIGTLFQYHPSIASLTGKGEERVEGAFLVIPLEVELQKDGYYKIEGNLFDAQNQPVSHVIAREQLKQPKGEVLMKVHASVLRDKKASGPYTFNTFLIERLPDKRGEVVEYGSSTGIDKQSLFGRGGHLRLKTVLKQGFHGSEDAGIGMGSQDRVKITLFKAPRQGWERARPGSAVRDADRGHIGPAASVQPLAYIMTGSVS